MKGINANELMNKVAKAKPQTLNKNISLGKDIFWINRTLDSKKVVPLFNIVTKKYQNKIPVIMLKGRYGAGSLAIIS